MLILHKSNIRRDMQETSG